MLYFLGNKILLRNKAWAIFLITTVLNMVPALLIGSHPDSIITQTDSICMGKELFFSDIQIGDTLRSCASCHFSEPQDTFHWNPSAFDISRKFLDKSPEDLEEALMYPMSDKAFNDHFDPALDETQIAMLKAFMDDNAQSGPLSSRPDRSRIIVFLVAVAMIVLVIIEVSFIKLFKKGVIRSFILVLATLTILVILYQEAIALGLQEDYEPDQPVKFSHKIHFKQNGTDCMYCHMPARYGKSAGLPSTAICMNCHAVIVEGTHSGSFEINRLMVYANNRNPIPWIHVNYLPEHVYFNHALHYSTGGIQCAECHGYVENDHRMRQIITLSMGWCLDCHASRKSKSFESQYSKDYYLKIRESLNMPLDSVLVKDLGGWECMKCHY